MELIKREYYVLKEGTHAYNWITIDNGGHNKQSLCFYDEGIVNKPYFTENADFGKNYSNFNKLIVKKANNLEINWLKESIKLRKLAPKPEKEENISQIIQIW